MESYILSPEKLLQYATEHRWKLLGALATGYLAYKVLSRPRNLPPGPRGLPGIGALLEFTADTHEDQIKLRKNYGDIASYYMGSQLHVWLNSTDVIKEAFVKRSDEFNHRFLPLFLDIMEWKYDIFFKGKREEWKRERKNYVTRLRSFGFGPSSAEGKIQAEVDILVDLLQKAQEEAGEQGIDLSDHLTTTAANFIVSIIYGVHYGPDDSELKRVKYLVKDLYDYNIAILGLMDILPTWIFRFFTPNIITDLPKRLQNLRNFMFEKIAQHKESHVSGEPSDFIDVMLDEQAETGMDDNAIADACIILMPDSMDQMPLAVEWLLLYVTKHPEVQAKIHAAIDEVIGRDRKPTLSNKPNLNYLEAVVMETLRLCTPVTLQPYHLVMDDVNLRGYNIPKNTIINGNISAVHFDPVVFPEPREFKPERFLDGEGNIIKSDMIMPFGVGPRMCIGHQLVRTEMFLIATNLLQKFEISFPKGTREPGITPHLVSYTRRPPLFKLVLKQR